MCRVAISEVWSEVGHRFLGLKLGQGSKAWVTTPPPPPDVDRHLQPRDE